MYRVRQKNGWFLKSGSWQLHWGEGAVTTCSVHNPIAFSYDEAVGWHIMCICYQEHVTKLWLVLWMPRVCFGIIIKFTKTIQYYQPIPFAHGWRILKKKWFCRLQQDGVTCRTTRITIALWNIRFLITSNRDSPCSTNSPKLRAWYFLLWGYIKMKVFNASPPPNIPEFKHRIH